MRGPGENLGGSMFNFLPDKKWPWAHWWKKV